MSKILAVIAPKDFRDEEYFVPKQILEQDGFEIVTASFSLGEIVGAGGKNTQAEVLVDDINISDFIAVYFVGGPGMIDLVMDTKLIRLAQEFFKAGKVTAAICAAVGILANADLLKGISATGWPHFNQLLISRGANAISKPVVWSGKIITAEGPAAASEFAQTIVKALNN